MTGRFFGQETVRTTVDDESALLQGVRYNLRLDLAPEAMVFLDQNELDVVTLGSGPGDFVSCAEPGNASADKDDPVNMGSLHLYPLPCLPQAGFKGEGIY